MSGIYSIFDEVKNLHLSIMVFNNDRECKRSIVSRFVKGQMDVIPDLKDYPNQFTIYKLAEFDDFSGVVTPIEKYSLLNLSTCVNDKGERYLIDV